jgi:hypothetical protein
VGPSSGVSFLLRVQKKLHQKVSFSPNSSIFTFGDAPLPEFDPSFFVLPPKDDAEKLVARYFEYAIATHRFLHRPTVEQWLEEFYDGLGVGVTRKTIHFNMSCHFCIPIIPKDAATSEHPIEQCTSSYTKLVLTRSRLSWLS